MRSFWKSFTALTLCFVLATGGVAAQTTPAIASSNAYFAGTIVGKEYLVSCTNWIYTKEDAIPILWVLNTADASREMPFSGTLRGTFRQPCNSSYIGLSKYSTKMELINPSGVATQIVGNPKINTFINGGRLLGPCGDIEPSCFDLEEQFPIEIPVGSEMGGYSFRYTVTWAGQICDWLGGSTFDCKPSTEKSVVTITNAIVFGALPAANPTVEPRPTALPTVTATPSPTAAASPKPNTAISTAPAPVQALTGSMSGKNIRYKFSKPYYASLVQYYSVKVSFLLANSKSPLYQTNFTTAKRIKVTRSTEFILSKAAIQKMAKAVGKSSAKYFSVTVTAVTPLGETRDSNGVYYDLK